MGSGKQPHDDAAMQHQWRFLVHMSSLPEAIEHRLERAGFDRAPWLVVAFAGGIALWFVLDSPWQWTALIGLCLLIVLGVLAVRRDKNDLPNIKLLLISVPVMVALGTAIIWARSEIVGQTAIERPWYGEVDGRILERDEQPARNRTRLVLAMRDVEQGRAIKIRINVPQSADSEQFIEGARIRLNVRLMPPAPPMLPGGYDFARAAWFMGLSATGSAVGEIELVEPASDPGGLAPVQRYLSDHVRTQVSGSPGTIAAALASGDRGGITEADEEAMRDAGLTHLLSISGLHVSAVIAAAYLLAIRLLAFWPWLALRVRLPLIAAGVAALAGVGYTLLTGAEVPTVRSCVGAILVLLALALGREPLSMRMVAVAAFVVLLVWPESLVGPSFQMSFAAVLAIIALHNSQPVKHFLAPRQESWFARVGRNGAMLLVTGLVIEIALMPIVLFHFHRAGVYGALANVIAIPLTTFVSMPLIASALLMDIFGLGAPFWWLVDQSLQALLGIAHFTASQPGSVKLMPDMGRVLFILFVIGGLWLALWNGRIRLLGLIPVGIATLLLLAKPTPDVLVSGDGRHVGIVDGDDRLLVLRDSRSSYARDKLLELAGMDGETIPLADWQGARCSRDFCVLSLDREGYRWHLLMARSRDMVEERALAAACERSDIVVADRYLPRSCHPRWLKADRRFLDRTGGLAINLESERVDTVAAGQGEHGWWRGKD